MAGMAGNKVLVKNANHAHRAVYYHQPLQRTTYGVAYLLLWSPVKLKPGPMGRWISWHLHQLLCVLQVDEIVTLEKDSYSEFQQIPKRYIS